MSAERPTKISIMATNHDYAHCIAECLLFVADQTCSHVECVVVDDGSADDSRDVIAGYRAFTSVFQDNSGHAIAARNGFDRPNGDMTVFPRLR